MTNSNHETGVTIDDLAIMIANGFRGVDKRFEAVDKRFEDIEERFCGVDGRFDGLEKRLTSLESKVDQMDMRLTSRMDNMVLNYVNQTEYSHLEKRVKKLELAKA